MKDFALIDDQDMALRNEDKAWIANEIRTAMQEYLQPHGWRKAFRVLRELAPLGGIFMMVIGLVAIIITLTIGITNRRESDARFQGTTEQRLNDIENQLRSLRASQSPGPVLNEISKLNQTLFAQSLPALRIVAGLPSSEVSPAPDTLKSVAEKLRNTDEQSPDYWPTVLQFIQFATSDLSPDAPPPGQPHLTIAQLTATGTVTGKTIELADGVRLQNITFVNCRIIFTENPVEFQNVRFVDSVFEFPIAASPSHFIQRATRVLLASDLKSLYFNLPQEG